MNTTLLFHEKPMPSKEELKKIFEGVQSADPKIKIDDSIVEINPYYWNYSFITNFPFIPVCIYILIRQNDLETNLLCVLGIAIFLFNIFYQLRFYNKLIINLQSKSIAVIPNIFTALYTKEKIIPLSKIKKIEYISDGFWLAYRRYIIRITVENSQEFKLISTKKENNAKKIVTSLLQLF